LTSNAPVKITSLPLTPSNKQSRLSNSLPESQVIKTWQCLLLNRTELITEEGQPIRVIYPGRLNSDRGPDFRDGVIATNRRLLKGDIEVHVKSSDWRAHRHHQDPYYNQVILHVVMWHNSRTATTLQNGRTIPILSLTKYLTAAREQWLNRTDPQQATPGMPCRGVARALQPDTITGFLDRTGEERFLAKASKFQAEIAQLGDSQSLYQGIMGALGYSKNKLPFLELARRLPLHILESVAQDAGADEECLARQQALLLGTAGLLPSQRSDWHQSNRPDDPWIVKLEKSWDSQHQTEAMPNSAWHLFKIRPNNLPVRRLVAMSNLILRYREKGLQQDLVGTISELPLSRSHHRLEESLLVTADGYWANHLDFGLPNRLHTCSLLGRERAADIVVNVLLPFTLAWGKLTSQPELEQKALNLYYSYPRLTANTVERHMSKQLGLDSRLVSSAQRQQGLIHIYSSLCTQGKCHCCQLGNYC